MLVRQQYMTNPEFAAQTPCNVAEGSVHLASITEIYTADHVERASSTAHLQNSTPAKNTSSQPNHQGAATPKGCCPDMDHSIQVC
jgi:hypothetical protein